MTAVDVSVIQKLGLQPTGAIGMNTPSSGAIPIQCSTYDIDMVIPAGSAMKHIRALPVVEADFSAQGHEGLIGRDILAEFRMIYSGPDDLVMLSY